MIFLAAKGGRSIAAFVVLFWVFSSNFGATQAAYRLSLDGVQTIGLVAHKRVEETASGRQFFRTFVYRVDGVVYQDEEPVPQGSYNDLMNGDEITVTYWRKDPSIYQIETRGEISKAEYILLICWGLGALACLLLWVSGLSASRAVLTRRLGRRQTAEIVEVVYWPVHLIWLLGHGYLIFETADGRRGTSYNRGVLTLKTFKKGGKISVFAWKMNVFWDDDVGPQEHSKSRIPKTR